MRRFWRWLDREAWQAQAYRVMCPREGEQLWGVPGQVIRPCDRCGRTVLVAEYTFAVLKGRPYDLVCLHCCAKEEPDRLLDQDTIMNVARFARARGGLPKSVGPVRTIKDLAALTRVVFGDGDV